MLSEGKIIMRPLINNDQEALARLANNKKIYDNVRDYFPFPYTQADAAAFINLTKQETTPSTFAIEYEKELSGIIGLVAQSDVYRKWLLAGRTVLE